MDLLSKPTLIFNYFGLRDVQTAVSILFRITGYFQKKYSPCSKLDQRIDAPHSPRISAGSECLNTRVWPTPIHKATQHHFNSSFCVNKWLIKKEAGADLWAFHAQVFWQSWQAAVCFIILHKKQYSLLVLSVELRKGERQLKLTSHFAANNGKIWKVVVVRPS